MSEYKRKYCVVFAGPVGSSKTPIAFHLSYTFGLPIFSNDSIRSEVAEDLLNSDSKECEKRRKKRLNGILRSGMSFIYDSSADRRWKELTEQLAKNCFRHFLISLDLSKKFLSNLLEIKGYTESLVRIDELILAHDRFLVEHERDINIHITDKNFRKRLKICTKVFSAWLDI